MQKSKSLENNIRKQSFQTNKMLLNIFDSIKNSLVFKELGRKAVTVDPDLK